MRDIGKLLRQDWFVLRQNGRPRKLVLILLLVIVGSLLAGRLSILIQLLLFMPIAWSGGKIFFADAFSLNILRTVQPLRRVQVVRARYAFVLLMHLAVGIAVGLPLCLSLALWGKGYLGNPLGALVLVIITLLLSVALECIRMPLYYKWGYGKLNALSLLYLLALPTAVFLVRRIWLDAWVRLDGDTGSGAGSVLELWLEHWNDVGGLTWREDVSQWLPLALVTAAIWLAIMTLSYTASVRIYKKSEF